MELDLKKLLRIVLIFTSVVIEPCFSKNQVNEDCGLNGYEAHCVLDIMDEHIEATAIVNHCHVPLDITFRVIYRYGNGTEQRWQYTFVTSNQNERVLIPGLTLPPAPYALVYLYARVPQPLFDLHNASVAAVEASFIAILSDDTWEEAEFLNEVITIDTIDDCFNHKDENNDRIIWIIGGTILGLLCIGATTTGVLWWYRRKKIAIDELALVSSLETGLPGAQPYQIGTSEHSCINNNIIKDGPKMDQNQSERGNKNSGDKSRNEGSGFGFNRLNEEPNDKIREKMAKKLEKAIVIGNPVLVDKTSLFKTRFNKLSPVSPEGVKTVKKVEAVGDAFENSYSVEEEVFGGEVPNNQTKHCDTTQSPGVGNEYHDQRAHNSNLNDKTEIKEDSAVTSNVGARPKENKRTSAD